MKIGFLLYDSRSGSTFLASLLNSHPEIFVSLEAEFILDVLDIYRKTGALPDKKEFRKILDQDKKLFEWKLDLHNHLNQLPEKITHSALHSFLETILLDAVEDAGRTTPRYLILKQGLLTGYLNELSQVLPDSTLIHIFRDGRAVYASKKRSLNVDTGLPMARDPVQAAHRWQKIQKRMMSFAETHRILEVKYENLIINLQQTLEKIWLFLGLKPPEAPLYPDEYASRIPESQRKLHRLVGKKPDKSRIEAWRHELSLWETKKYESRAGDILKKRRYSLIFSLENPMNTLSFLSKRIFRAIHRK